MQQFLLHNWRKRYQPVKVLVLFVSLFCLGYSLKAQSIQTFISSKSLLIGEQIQYRLQFTLPTSNYSVDFNIPDSFPHFEVLDKMKFDSTNPRGNYLIVQNISLTSWDSGRWTIPSFPIKIRNQSDKAEYVLNTDSLVIDVGYAPADSTNELRDIKPVMDVFYVDQSWIYWAAGILTALILAIILYRYFKRRPKKEKPIFDSRKSAYNEAVEALKVLAAQSPFTSTEIKAYHVELGDIFKRYSSRKQGVNLLTKTTDELLLNLKSKEGSTNILSQIAEALRVGDAVKFAKYQTSEEERKQNWHQIAEAINWIEKQNAIIK